MSSVKCSLVTLRVLQAGSWHVMQCQGCCMLQCVCSNLVPAQLACKDYMLGAEFRTHKNRITLFTHTQFVKTVKIRQKINKTFHCLNIIYYSQILVLLSLMIIYKASQP